MSIASQFVWPAPAKLNLMLRVVGRREDGYHLLQTVFQFLEFGDELRFRLRQDGRIMRKRSLPGVKVEDDLVVKAARLLLRRAEARQGVEVDLDKRLPIGGGLGGGSSDAATVLVALNAVLGLGLDTNELAALGLGLGADVPIFVQGHAAWAEGVGEQLVPLELEEPWYLVLIPPCQVSTKTIFSDPDLTRDSPRIKIADFLAGDSVNDCLSIARRSYPEVGLGYDWLSQHARAHLTGTGGCLFASFDSRSQALNLLEKKPSGWGGFVSRGRNLSPLREALRGLKR